MEGREQGGGGNEAEELEIDVTAVARNDSRFVASSRFIARKKKKKEKGERKKRGTERAHGLPMKINASATRHVGRKQDGLIVRVARRRCLVIT